jgi:hypothetical protein
MKKNNKGFAPIIIILLIVVVLAGGIYIAYKDYKSANTLPSQTSSSDNSFNLSMLTPSPATTSTTLAPTATSKSVVKTVTPVPTIKPTATAQSTSSNGSCPYNTTGTTGAIKINVHPQAGILLGDQLAEVDAQSGCNVLLGSSSYTYTIKSAGNGTSSLNSITISSISAGPFSIKIRYKDQWTSYTNINVSSASLTTTDIYVSGDPAPTIAATPTPTPLPKPVCFDPIPYPASGKAPLSVNFQPQGSAGNTMGMSEYDWDYMNNGSWSSSGLNMGNHTYQSPGTYTINMRILSINGQYSDNCQTTVTVTQ